MDQLLLNNNLKMKNFANLTKTLNFLAMTSLLLTEMKILKGRELSLSLLYCQKEAHIKFTEHHQLSFSITYCFNTKTQVKVLAHV